MMLLTKEIRNKLPELYAMDGQCHDQIPIIVKFFNPVGAATWFCWEGSPVIDEDEDSATYGQEIDFMFFGLCDLGMGFPEMGYVSLNELESVKLAFGLGIERDRGYNATAADVLTKYGLGSLVKTTGDR